MKLIRQPNRWSCGIAAMSMLLDEPIDELCKILGHDGSEVLWESQPEPSCRRGFSPAELVDLAEHYGFAMLEVPCEVWHGNSEEDAKLVEFKMPGNHTPLTGEERLLSWMKTYSGLVVGRYSMDRPHAVAWDCNAREILDPHQPRRYDFWTDPEAIIVETFFPIVRFRWPAKATLTALSKGRSSSPTTTESSDRCVPLYKPGPRQCQVIRPDVPNAAA